MVKKDVRILEEEYGFDVEMHIDVSKEKIEQNNYYCVKALGGLNIKKNKLKSVNYEGDYVLYCDDVTDIKNVIKIKSQLSNTKDNDGLFFLRRNNIKLSWGCGYADYTNIFLIEESEFIPPYSGERLIEFKFYIVKPNSIFSNGVTAEENILFQTEMRSPFFFKRFGYLDNFTKVDEVDANIVQLSLAVANLSGSIGKAELGVVKNWIEAKNKWGLDEILHPELYDNKENIKKKAFYNQLLKYSFDKITEKKLIFSEILKKLNEKAYLSEKYEAINLLLNVVSADNKFTKKENDLLNKIVSSFELEETEFNKMKEKILATVDEVEGDKTNESLFNITAKMSKDEKCKLLRKEYSRWNAQTNNSDTKIKARAKRMVEMAAKLRSKYKC